VDCVYLDAIYSVLITTEPANFPISSTNSLARSTMSMCPVSGSITNFERLIFSLPMFITSTVFPPCRNGLGIKLSFSPATINVGNVIRSNLSQTIVVSVLWLCLCLFFRNRFELTNVIAIPIHACKLRIDVVDFRLFF